MNSDAYLDLAKELYENNTWSKDVFSKRVRLYAKSMGVEDAVIEDFIERTTMPKEYSIEEKREILSAIKLDEEELKYGDVVNFIDDARVNKLFELEEKLLGKDKIYDYYKSAKKSILPNKENNNITSNTSIDMRKKDDNFLKQPEPLDLDSKKPFVVPPRPIVEPLDTYDINITTGKKEDVTGEKVPEFKAPERIEEDANEVTGALSDNEDVNEATSTLSDEQKKKLVVPPISFDDMPSTEEEYQKEAERITKEEKDSSVRIVNASPERIEKLKKGKRKIINFFIKTAIVIVAFNVLGTVGGIASVIGYLYFASDIKNGRFIPKNNFQRGIGKVVETIMNIGVSKEEDKEYEEKGRTR